VFILPAMGQMTGKWEVTGVTNLGFGAEPIGGSEVI